MTTYTLRGIVLQERPDGTVTGIRDTSFEVVVPDEITTLTSVVRGFNEDGEPLLEVVANDNDIRLDGQPGYREVVPGVGRDLSFLSVAWTFEGASGTSILFNVFDNDTNESFIFEVGGDPLPDGSFASPQIANAFLASTTISLPSPNSGFVPGQPVSLPSLPGVEITQDDRAADNRNNEATGRSYDFGIGTDTFDAGRGSDTVDGGDGSDTVHYEFIQGAIRANLTTATRDGIAPGTVQKTSGTDTLISIENLLGTNLSDVIYLADGAGFVFDRSGNDRVEGGTNSTLFQVGSGSDTLIGGADDDVLIFGDDGFDGAGGITQGAQITLTGVGEGTAIDGWGGEDVFSGMTGGIEGTALADTFQGSDGDDEFIGDAGNDTIIGGAGDDTLIGGAGDDLFRYLAGGSDRFDGGEGRDGLITDVTALAPEVLSVDLAAGTHGREGSDVGRDTLLDIEDFTMLGDWVAKVRGSDLDNRIVTGAGADEVAGRGGDDDLNGGSGRDTLAGGDGNDTLDGGAGVDRMDGGSGDDVYRLDNVRDLIIEAVGRGDDTVRATAEVTLGAAEIETVILEGDAGLRVNGNGFATEITGNVGSNILIGGGGGDVVTGGGGKDFFAFLVEDAAGAMRITDFGGTDQLAIDDRYFGLGDASIDARAVTDQQAANALASGAFRYDGRTGELFIDRDGRRGPEDPVLIAVIEGGGALTADDVLLF